MLKHNKPDMRGKVRHLLTVATPTAPASTSAQRSLSITQSIPTFYPFSSITGIPPPPQQIGITFYSTSALIASISTILFGYGEATTMRYPLPESSLTVYPCF